MSLTLALAAYVDCVVGAPVERLLAEVQMQGVTIAQVTPSPYRISSLLAKEFTDTVAKTPNLEVPVSYIMME